MNRIDLLYRAKHDAQYQQDRALALSAFSSILRRDALVKGDDGHDKGLTLAELDGLACALSIMADGMWEAGEQLAELATKHLPTRNAACEDLDEALAAAGQRQGGAK